MSALTTSARPTAKKANGSRLNPCKDNPAEAERHVRRVFKMKPNNLDLAATELAPLYGLGAGSTFDVVARGKAQAVFVCPELHDYFGEFAMLYLGGEWSVPLAEWQGTMELVRKHQDDPVWNQERCPCKPDWGAGHYYARFLILTMHAIRNPSKSTQLLHWMRDADLEDAYWVLFHALMYLQLETMQLNRECAPFSDRVNHYKNKLTGTGSLLDRLRNFMSVRSRDK
ncbi:hypothetical protein F5X96DRAFT_425603 [Biscogniauxia mediterranea]|nr:hypothetical protein F5X96DRAFT_425603 [Biscogniauxia mediterranea]